MAGGDRKPYLSFSGTLTQEFLDLCHDNLCNQLEMIVEIDTPDTGDPNLNIIRVSDRNKYVGDAFYEARVNFPIIRRILGEWLVPTLNFSVLTISINNSDSRFNNFLPGEEGENFESWIDKEVRVKLGLRDVESTYQEIFVGNITEAKGFTRSVKDITIVARNEFDKLNEVFPADIFTVTEFPDIEPTYLNKLKPLIYGDWTVNLNEDTNASIPAIPVNGLPQATKDGLVNLQLYISANANTSFDTANVVLVRSGNIYTFDAGDITAVPTGNNTFEIKQVGTGGSTVIDGSPFQYKSSDKIYVRVKGKFLGSGGIYDDNIIEQARDIVLTYSGLDLTRLDATWTTFRDKTSPPESAISTFKSRIYRNRAEKVMTYVLSLLEQVRLEGFIDRNRKFTLRSLHFDDFTTAISAPNEPLIIRNWDVERGQTSPTIDEKNNFNRAKGFFNRLPDINDNSRETAFYKNQASIDQTGKTITKAIVYPNLYEESVVVNQLSETLKLSSSFFEIIDTTFTWRSLLLDIGDFVRFDVQIGSAQFDNAPCLIREIGYSAKGLKLPVKLWSMQMTPFTGWNPGYEGIVGGSSAIIEEEVTP